jgi:hypothetical protein
MCVFAYLFYRFSPDVLGTLILLLTTSDMGYTIVMVKHVCIFGRSISKCVGHMLCVTTSYMSYILCMSTAHECALFSVHVRIESCFVESHGSMNSISNANCMKLCKRLHIQFRHDPVIINYCYLYGTDRLQQNRLIYCARM